jgi:hypothetical protein
MNRANILRVSDICLRHILLCLIRFYLSIGIGIALPSSYRIWGDVGGSGLSMDIALLAFGMEVGAIFFMVGTIVQVYFRKKSACFTVFVDLGLFSILTILLVIGGATSKYGALDPHTSSRIAPY